MADDQYHMLEVDGLSTAQAEVLTNAIADIAVDGVGVNAQEYTHLAGNPQLKQNTMRISVGGPDIDAFLTEARNEIAIVTGSGAEVDVPVITEASRVRTAKDVLAGRTEQIKVIDSLLFSMASGNLVSRKDEVYTANGTIAYHQTGPTIQLPAVDLQSDDAYFTNNSPSDWMKPHNANFFVEWWAKHKPGNATNTQAFWDYSTTNGTEPGVAVVYTNTLLQLVVTDGVKLHITEYNHGGALWEDSAWHRGGFAAMRDSNKANLFVDNILVTTTKQPGTAFLHEIGDIDPPGGVRVGGRAHIAGADNLQFRGEVAAVRLGGIVV